MRDQNDELLRRYLLGELAEEEESLLEARLLQDDGLFEGMEAMEADLLDEYAHGRLSSEERARIERRLVSSPQGRLRLAVIRGLGKVAEEEANGHILPFRRLKQAVSRPGFRTAASIAAMLVIAIVAFSRPVPPIEAFPHLERHIAWRQDPPVPADWDRIAGRDSEEIQIADTEPTPAPQRLPFVFSELALMTLRGDGDPVPELRVPSGTEQVEIHLPLSQGDESYSSYQVVLRDPVGKELVRLEELQPTRLDEGAVLILPVEAKLLRAGRHEVEVSGDGKALAFPQFEIPKP